MDEIDLVTCIAGDNNDSVDYYVPTFLDSLRSKCNLELINVFLVLRECLTVSDTLKKIIESSGFKTQVCSLPRFDNCREDTSRVCNWMVENCGNAPWVAVTHYDIVFHEDYFQYARKVMPSVGMIGGHHDGIVLINRQAYDRCRVGFTGLDSLRISKNSSGEFEIVSINNPNKHAMLDDPCLSLDVGQLLEMRMTSLGIDHVWHRRSSDLFDVGKSNLFTHHRDGSTGKGYAARQRAPTEVPITIDPILTKAGEVMEQVNASGQTITLIHFTHEVNNEWRIACMPGMVEFGQTMYHSNYQRANDVRAVTCPACQKSSVFKDSHQRLEAALRGPVRMTMPPGGLTSGK